VTAAVTGGTSDGGTGDTSDDGTGGTSDGGTAAVTTVSTAAVPPVTDGEPGGHMGAEATETVQKTAETTKKAGGEDLTAASAVAAAKPAEYAAVSVDFTSVIARLDELTPAKLSVLPKDGVILADVKNDGAATVYDALAKACAEKNVKLSHSGSGADIFIISIGGLANGDIENCYWFYTVNGKQPDVGIGAYKMQKGDKIRVYYEASNY